MDQSRAQLLALNLDVVRGDPIHVEVVRHETLKA
jgi:hypothetical protein